jgi:drug/metabolite transporter (DMT)-like permease
MQNVKLKNYLHLHFIVFIWGFTAVIGALISLDAMPLVWYRMALAVGFILIYMAYKKMPLRVPPKALIGFLFAGLIIALHWFTFFKAIKVSNISITLACLSTGAFFASLLEPLFYGRKVIWYEVFFGVLVVVGLYIIFNVEGDSLHGILLALTSAFLSALFSVINGKYAKEYDPTLISFYELIGGVLFFSLFLVFTSGFSPAFFTVSASDWFYLALLSSFCTAYAFIASVKVMQYLSPYTVMLTTNLEPIYGIILALIIFQEKEKMSTGFYFGALLILFTVVANGFVKYFRKQE